MKHTVSRLAVLFLACIIGIGALEVSAFAQTTGKGLDIEGMLAEKTAEEQDSVGEYEVTIQVPGTSQQTQYAEIIIMADASDSINDGGNWPHFRNIVNALGDELLSDHTSLKLTLMGYGIGARHAGTFTSLPELHAFMDVATSADFMQERSATNCEVGFTFAENYIRNSPDISKTYVIYISDAGANLDETPLDWSKWADVSVFDYFKNFSLAQVKAFIIGTEAEHIAYGHDPLAITAALFPEKCGAIQTVKADLGDAFAPDHPDYGSAVEALYEEMSQNSEAYVSALLEDIHTYSGLTYGQSYSSSVIELAFKKYYSDKLGQQDSYYDTYMDSYYLILGDTGSTKLTERNKRAAQASLSLQNCEKVLGLYHVCYSKNISNWMNPSHVQENYGFSYTNKVKYLYGANFGQAITALENSINEISNTIYKDVFITDPMSQWVHLEPDTIAIYNGKTKIYQYGQSENAGWLIENPPVVDESGNPKDPIVLTLNEKGFYEITWYVKTGNLLLSDHYSMKYTVNLNEEAEGYIPGTPYPLNDPTTASYTDENGEPQTVQVPVPQGAVYAADYVYVSGTPGLELPENFVPVPVDPDSYADTATVVAKTPEVLTFTDPENDGMWSFRAWDADTKQILQANVTFVGEWVFTANTYTVSYQYVSGTPELELPENFVPVPVDPDSYASKTTVAAKAPEALTFTDPDNNGVWSFRAWDADTKQVFQANVTFVGEWVFTANQSTPSTPPASSPNTADSGNLLLWFGLLMASGLGLICTALSCRKKYPA